MAIRILILETSVQCLGKVGTIKLTYPSEDIVIHVSGGVWLFNPLNLTPAHMWRSAGWRRRSAGWRKRRSSNHRYP